MKKLTLFIITILFSMVYSSAQIDFVKVPDLTEHIITLRVNEEQVVSTFTFSDGNKSSVMTEYKTTEVKFVLDKLLTNILNELYKKGYKIVTSNSGIIDSGGNIKGRTTVYILQKE